MIRLNSIHKIYQSGEIALQALNNISLTIHHGDFVSIMGHSGCGKSTLLNIIGLLSRPSSGSYHFGELNLLSLSEKQQSGFRKKNIGFIFQNFNLIDQLTVEENVSLPLLYSGIATAERKERVQKMLALVDMHNRASYFPRQLSGGQQQRIAVARAIIHNPRLVLADEPTGNLDSKNGNRVMELLSQLNDAGTTVVMVTHSEYDSRFSKRTVVMGDGQIITEKYNYVGGSLV